MHCRFVLALIRFIPDSLAYLVPLFLKRQCDRTLGTERECKPGQRAHVQGEVASLLQHAASMVHHVLYSMQQTCTRELVCGAVKDEMHHPSGAARRVPGVRAGRDQAAPGRRGGARARSHCRSVPPLIHFMPDSLTYSVPLCMKGRCARIPGEAETCRRDGHRAHAEEGRRS